LKGELTHALGDAAVGVDADQMVVERGMVDLREGDPVGDDRLAQQLSRVGHDMRRVQQMIIRQVADRAPELARRKAAFSAG
jgi:hypothetical protein